MCAFPDLVSPSVPAQQLASWPGSPRSVMPSSTPHESSIKMVTSKPSRPHTVSDILATVLSDTSSVSNEIHTSLMTEMLGMVDPGDRSTILIFDNANCIDTKELSQLLGSKLRKMNQQRSQSKRLKISSSINLSETTSSPLSTILDSNLLYNCLDDVDNHCEQWNYHQISDEIFPQGNEDDADDEAGDEDQKPLLAKSAMIRGRIWTVFADLGMGIMTRQESIIRSYAHQQQNESAVDGIPHISRNLFCLQQSRTFISIIKLLAYIYELLGANQSITCRALYYFFKDWFGTQSKCNYVIDLACGILMIDRCSLGIVASSKGWFCGSFEISRRGTLTTGQEFDERCNGTCMKLQGKPITHEWITRDENGVTKDGIEIEVMSKDAKVILVVEHEGVYQRLSEDRIFDRHPCILVTGRGFPDVATRALVHALHRELRIPVVGIADCDPYGISLISTYFDAGDHLRIDGGRRYSVPIKFVGLMPSQVYQVKNKLRPDQLQVLEDTDITMIDRVLNKETEDHFFATNEEVRRELMCMRDMGFKVSLDALRSIQHDYITTWITNMLKEI